MESLLLAADGSPKTKTERACSPRFCTGPHVNDHPLTFDRPSPALHPGCRPGHDHGLCPLFTVVDPRTEQKALASGMMWRAMQLVGGFPLALAVLLSCATTTTVSLRSLPSTARDVTVHHPRSPTYVDTCINLITNRTIEAGLSSRAWAGCRALQVRQLSECYVLARWACSWHLHPGPGTVVAPNPLSTASNLGGQWGTMILYQ